MENQNQKSESQQASSSAGGAPQVLSHFLDQAQVDKAKRVLSESVSRYPYASLGVAFGLGFMLGGGVISRKITWNLVKYGGRWAATNYIKGAFHA